MLLDARQQDVPVIVKELVLPHGFDSVSSSFIVRDNENTAKLAGVSLSLDGLQETNTRVNNQNVENINSDEDHGLLVVSAENVVRKPSPTADALGSAELFEVSGSNKTGNIIVLNLSG
ncbi:unnamed protein product [Schistosoma margrebowiei]|uniref:Uncharacterized protein n=1 Tax=Schistosoma margrebowiei TaxID=48269 RepID=A0A183LK40_9TREM|nr:unnamed protein product [Schistosoma margrebowiei]